jgi:hypothetical protein
VRDQNGEYATLSVFSAGPDFLLATIVDVPSLEMRCPTVLILETHGGNGRVAGIRRGRQEPRSRDRGFLGSFTQSELSNSLSFRATRNHAL